MKKMFPEYEENIVNDGEMKSIFNVLTTANDEGYDSVNIIVGSDRQSEFENLANKYNGELYDFEEINVISAGVRDADSEGVEGMSASKMRKAVMDDDFESFRKGTPSELMTATREHCLMLFVRGWEVRRKQKLLRCGRLLQRLIQKDCAITMSQVRFLILVTSLRI